ncbi:MAG: hypothetical protein JSV77_00905 [Dehalococcoidales bacterium]|nr:MAG: hypothetical protein JSV77_00905 [Dehalococcoidales bacterium]
MTSHDIAGIDYCNSKSTDIMQLQVSKRNTEKDVYSYLLWVNKAGMRDYRRVVMPMIDTRIIGGYDWVR